MPECFIIRKKAIGILFLKVRVEARVGKIKEDFGVLLFPWQFTLVNIIFENFIIEFYEGPI